MNIDLPRATSLDEIPPGEFFLFVRSGNSHFGLCVAVPDAKAAIIFNNERRRASPLWLNVGGLTNDTLVRLPDVVVRADLSIISTEEGQRGTIIGAAGSFYIRVPVEELGHYRTFNMKTGLLEAPAEDAKKIYFARWYVGRVVDGEFEQIFSFPSAPTAD
jgi:hypothetical protein